jgi:hypothetical protein
MPLCMQYPSSRIFDNIGSNRHRLDGEKFFGELLIEHVCIREQHEAYISPDFAKSPNFPVFGIQLQPCHSLRAVCTYTELIYFIKSHSLQTVNMVAYRLAFAMLVAAVVASKFTLSTYLPTLSNTDIACSPNRTRSSSRAPYRAS